MKIAYKERTAIYHEMARLINLGNPHIIFANGVFYIDLWCDGNEPEADRIIKITQKHRRLLATIIRSENEIIY